MSSVALIVCAAPAPGADTLVRKLDSRSDHTIAVDGGAEVCLSAGIVPDVVVGDLDSLSTRSAEVLKTAGVRFAVVGVDKDVTDLDLAILEARSSGAGSVVVTGAFSRRLDHTLAAVGTIARAADLRPQLAEPGQTGWVLSAGHRASVEIGPTGQVFSCVPITHAATVSIDGARWPLRRATLDVASSRGVSNRVTDSQAVVRVHTGTVLVLRCDPDVSARTAFD